MKIALIGFSGLVGSRVLAELRCRGHTVTGIARDVKSIASQPGLSLCVGDVTSAAELASLCRPRCGPAHRGSSRPIRKP
jgi:putative NADH-flavin reductase